MSPTCTTPPSGRTIRRCFSCCANRSRTLSLSPATFSTPATPMWRQRPLCRAAVQIAPVYYVTGNHESRIPQAFAQLEERMTAAGAQILRNQSLYWEREGQRVQLIGLDDPSFLAQESQLEDHLHSLQDEDCYQILLSHRPELFDVYAAAGVDLSLTGHGPWRAVPHPVCGRSGSHRRRGSFQGMTPVFTFRGRARWWSAAASARASSRCA